MLLCLNQFFTASLIEATRGFLLCFRSLLDVYWISYFYKALLSFLWPPHTHTHGCKSRFKIQMMKATGDIFLIIQPSDSLSFNHRTRDLLIKPLGNKAQRTSYTVWVRLRPVNSKLQAATSIPPVALMTDCKERAAQTCQQKSYDWDSPHKICVFHKT